MAPARTAARSPFKVLGGGAVLVAATLLGLVFGAAGGGNKPKVTCGSTVKLQHDRTKFKLHSHEVAYGSGSGQQSVTGFPGGEDTNSYWVVRAGYGSSCDQGSEIQDGQVIRLQHLNTRKWLHSHTHPSPITNNQEVSGYGDDQNSDSGDNWKVEVDSGKSWVQDQKVRFLHVDTSMYLQTHDKKYGRPIAGQQEVCAVRKKGADTAWMATEGVFFPTRA